MRNCIAENNTGYGYLFSLTRLNQQSTPVSIRVENCSSSGTSNGLVFITKNDLKQCVQGHVEFENCTFKSTKQAAFQLYNKPATACSLKFKKCTFAVPTSNISDTAPINFIARAGALEKIGGINFERCTIKTNARKNVMSFTNSSYIASVNNVTGNLRVKRNNHVTHYTLTQKWIDKWVPPGKAANIKPYRTDRNKLIPMASNTRSHSFKTRPVRRRFAANYAIYAAKGDSVSTTMTFHQIVKDGSKQMPVTITAPSGKVVKTVNISINKKNGSSIYCTPNRHLPYRL